MAVETLLGPAGIDDVLRIQGEDDPDAAALAYERAIEPALAEGISLQILGMGDDCHIAALFPGSPALHETERTVIAVDRPDGLRGITLTPAALVNSDRTFVIVTGEDKAGPLGTASAPRPGTDRDVPGTSIPAAPSFFSTEQAAFRSLEICAY